MWTFSVRQADCLARWTAVLLLWLGPLSPTSVGEATPDPKSVPPSPHLNRGDDLFAHPALHSIKLQLTDQSVRSLHQNPRQHVPAQATIDGRTYLSLELHLKGSAGSFRPIDDKPALTLSFTDPQPKGRFCGLRKVLLNNCVQDSTYLSELICSEMFRAAGVPATRVSYAWVQLNDRVLGLYTLEEAFTHDFLAHYFHNTRGNLYGQSEGADVTEPLGRVQGDGENTHEDLKRLVAAAQERDPAQRWERLQSVLDIDRFLSFMALEVMLCHWDGYTFAQHNYRVYHDLDTGRMVFFPHDMDQMLGDPNTPVTPMTSATVPQALLKIPEGRLRYRERFEDLFANVFQVEKLTSRIDSVVAQLAPAIRRYDPDRAREFENSAGSLKDRIVERRRVLASLLKVPEPKSLQFDKAVPVLAGWQTQTEQGDVDLSRDERQGTHVLRIKCLSGGGVGSWRTSVLLGPGRYHFHGRAKSLGVVARTDARGNGGGLRISGKERTNQLTGDSDWVELDHEFAVDSDLLTIVLVCELRATQGEIWFDLGSLELKRAE